MSADLNVIVETLERVTDAAESATSVKSRLGAVVDGGIRCDDVRIGFVVIGHNVVN